MIELIKKQFGASMELDYEIRNKRAWLMSKDARDFGLDIPIISKGVYFGYLEHDGLRLSIEGSQIVGRHATKNILELGEKEMQDWLNGMNLDKKCKKGYLILKFKKDFVGCGKSNGEKIWNFVPKERRIRHFKKA